MKIAITAAFFCLVLLLLPAGVFTRICHPLNPSLFQRCIKVGYNYTARFPENFTFHENIIGDHLERETRQFKQCSKYLDVMMCSIFVPKCAEDHYSPILPCRRICDEFVKDCEPRVDYEKLESIKGLCRLLPSKQNDKKSAECFEPATHKPRGNSTIPIIQKCAKLQMSSCLHLGYTHTIQGEDMQLILDNVLKGRLQKFGNHSVCSATLKKIFCAEFAPPCFPKDKEEIVLRTACKYDCEKLQKKCPELYKEHFGEYNHCEQMGTESSDLDGFCKVTQWPTAVRWPARPDIATPVPSPRSPVPSSSSSTTPTTVSFVPSSAPLYTKVSISVTVVVVSSVVVGMSIIGIVAALVLRKKRRFTEWWIVRGYRQQLNERETALQMKT